MKKNSWFSLISSKIEVVTIYVVVFLLIFVFPHNGLTLFFCLFLPIWQLIWMILIIRNQIRQHCIGKAIAVLFANMLPVGIEVLMLVIMIYYLPKKEDSVMNEQESKQFGIYVASYACKENVILDSIKLDLDCWTQYSNNYVSFQNKEDIMVTPRFICYSCIIKNELFYKKMVQMDYGLDWHGHYRKDSSGNNYVFAECSVTASEVKDTIVMHITNLGEYHQIVDSLIFIRTTDPQIPDWSVCQKLIKRHVSKSYKQRFLDRIYYDYFWQIHI